MNKMILSGTSDDRWHGLYRTGGISALVIVVLLLGEVMVYAVLPGTTGILAEILENSSKSLLMAAIAFYFAAIVFLLVWVLLTGKRLRHLAADLYKS